MPKLVAFANRLIRVLDLRREVSSTETMQQEQYSRIVREGLGRMPMVVLSRSTIEHV